MDAHALPRGLRLTIIGSAILHVGVVVGLVVGTSGSSRAKHPVETVITTKLVRLGKERPKELLPRKVAPPPAPAKAAPSVAPSDPKATPAPKPAKSADDRLREMRNLTSALNRLKNASQEDPEGHPDGSPDGEVSRLTEALIGNKYATEIYACVKKYYSIEGVAPEKVKNRRASVFVRVNGDGAFFDLNIEKGSGLRAFDSAVERAVKRCAKVSPPPKEIARQVREDGIEFDFQP